MEENFTFSTKYFVSVFKTMQQSKREPYASYDREITPWVIFDAGIRHVINEIVACQISSVLNKLCTKALVF